MTKVGLRNTTSFCPVELCQRFAEVAASTSGAQKPYCQSTDEELREAIHSHETHF